LETLCEVIHLDTNCLVALTTVHSPSRPRLLVWLQAGEQFATSAVAWSEFLNGPVPPPDVQSATNMIQGRIIPFDVAEAAVAAELFNRTGRRRGSTPDCFIAATAICARAPLATDNRKDFVRFVPFGLQLA
jgi:predicted nucleic acid-binding protein